MIEVIPGILEQSFSAIVEKLRLVEEFCPWIQIDLLDNSLFGNTSFHDASAFTNLRTTSKLELHMMVVHPENFVDEWASVGFKRFIGHVEGMTNVENFITKVRSKKLEVGLAIDIETDVKIIEPFLPNIDCVLVMGIHTGKSGQVFDDRAITKIHKIKLLAPNLPIEVDGGVNDETAGNIVQAGANRLVSTSYLFNSPHIPQAIKKLQNL